MSLITRFQGPNRLAALVCLGSLALACGATHSPEESPATAQRAFDSRAPQHRASAALATGNMHTCAVLADGTARCWGENNTAGELGDGTEVNSSTPVSPSGLSTVISVASSEAHTCALRSDGTVRCWGWNASGQLGDGTTITPRTTPVAVDNVTNAVAIALGFSHSCALIADGTVRCWGSNGIGQLGDGTTVSRSTAAPVSTISNAIAIAAYYYQTCALISGGTIRCWGKNTSGQLGDGTTTTRTTPVSVGGLGYVTAIGVGISHTCALLEDGTVRCWGGNSRGELGDGTTSSYTVTPVAVSGLSDVVNLATGNHRTCALLGDGTARCWGMGNTGALGNGTYDDSSTPVTVSGISDAVAISTGGGHSCAILASGSLRCWGMGPAGQLGNGSTSDSSTPVAVSGISNALGGARLATGGNHTCAARPDGTVACWGYNYRGQLGDGTTMARTSPVTVSGLSNVVALTAGHEHTCALLGDGTAKCWGGSLYSGLGYYGNTVPSSTPVPVTGLTNAVAISAGRYHNCALRSDGTIMCWGKNTNGECGDGTTGGGRSTAVQVTGIPDSGGARAVAIAAGDDHTCALLTDGRARCWGDNASGQLGDGTTTAHVTPAAVSVLANAVAITAGKQHTCAVTASGAAYCWGDDSQGRVGDGAGSSGTVTRPVAVSGLSGAVTITAGGLHTCATTAAGGAQCWGYNYRGQLGDTTNTDRYVPATVQGTILLSMASAVTIDAGEYHTCAMRSNGIVRCWGDNNWGQLGDGTNTDSTLPVTVIGFP